MKKYYLLLTTLTFICFSGIHAQEFPWPDLGEPMIIEPGDPGTIEQTIMGDTTETGERIHNHFILRRGQTYLYRARINNVGHPLMVTAEEGDGALPIIKALGPAPGEEEAERIFHAQGDLYIQNIVMNGFDQGGNFTDNATVRLASDSITVVAKNVVFDFNRQNSIRINAVGCSVFVENSIIGNQGIAQRVTQGFALAFRGNPIPIVHLRNNTIYNMNHEVVNNQAPAIYNKFIFENNTIVNTGTGGGYLGRPDTLIFRNNLFVNVGVMGDAWEGDRENFVEPYYFFDIDTLFTDTTNTEIQDPSLFEFDYNHFYLDPAIIELIPDSAAAATTTMFHPYIMDLMGENNVVSEEAFEFTNFPAEISGYEAYINDFYEFAAEPAQLPLFDADFRDLDFSYPESHPAFTAASDGGPLGDRTWFPDFAVSNRSELIQDFLIYPNPTQSLLSVRDMENVTSIEISNIMGQRMKLVEDVVRPSIDVDVSNLQNGMYFVTFRNGAQVLGSAKILKQ